MQVRLAATVMILRDGAAGMEVFMLRRASRSAFAPDAFVFPGGAVEPQDASIEGGRRVVGLTLQALDDQFRMTVRPELRCDVPQPDSERAAALMRAALREVFEESGILLACGQRGRIDAAEAFSGPVQAQRAEIRNGGITFDRMLENHGWYADAGELSLFSHWITPAGEPRRYDTYFFAVRAPADQAGSADAEETHDERWIAPAEALRLHAAGAMHLVYPTIKHLERLAAFTDVGSLLQFTRNKSIVTIMPSSTPDEGFVMPAALEREW